MASFGSAQATKSSRLEAMLKQLEKRAPRGRIDLGLERVHHVLSRLRPNLDNTRVISIAGTNGKGSTVAFLESLALSAGRSCLAFTSPHVLHFGERIRYRGRPVSDENIVTALTHVEQNRGGVELTWFEQITLAAFYIAGQMRPDWLIAEVGLGGRLDAVNALDADVSIITSIGLDHQAFLGRTRKAIAREKIGIARSGKPLIVAERRPPAGMSELLDATGADLYRAREQFDWRWRDRRLTIRDGQRRWSNLTLGLDGLHQGGNAAAAVVAARRLVPDIGDAEIVEALASTTLTGRFQTVAEKPRVIVDVAHNPAAARMLADQLRRLDVPPVVVFGALADKDIAGMAEAVMPVSADWFLAGLSGDRGLSADELAKQISATTSGGRLKALESVPQALAQARDAARSDQAVVVFGSFVTVAEAIACIHPVQE